MGAFESFAIQDGAVVFAQSFASGFEPPPRLTVTEWADQFRRLPTKGASEPGRWRTDRVPFLAEIMDCMSAGHPAKRVVFIKSVQVGATECLNNVVGWFVDTQKAPLMVVQPTLEMAERWSKQRLASMIEDSPSLSAKIAPARSRDSGNTTLLKEWPGGVMVISGANSGASLRSMPASYVLLDEVDAYPEEIEGEGDPVRLAEARATTFPRRKILLISTPTIESLSRVNKEWLASDQRRFHVPCPHCGHEQAMIWAGLRWPKEHPDQAVYQCAACDKPILEHHKTEMLRAGRWIATHPDRDVPGFHINGLYTPIGLGLTWAELATEWVEASKDSARQKTFINLRLGEVVADPEEKLDPDDLAARAGHYKLRQIPSGCLAITVGIDVQKDRFAILMLGHGRSGAMWIIDWLELPADPTTPEAWTALDDWLAEIPVNSRGISMRPLMVAIDSGYLTDNVLAWTRERARRGVIAVKGASTPGKPIINKPSKLDVTIRGKTIRHGAEGWLVGVDTAKTYLFNRLAADGKRTMEQARAVQFPEGLDASFFNQITAEIWDPNRRRWIKIRPRNEALDTWVYAIAAAHHPAVRLHLWKEPRWAQLEAVLEPQTADLFSGHESQSLSGKTPAAPAPATLPPDVPQPVAQPGIRGVKRVTRLGGF